MSHLVMIASLTCCSRCVPVEKIAQTSCAVQLPAELIPIVIEAVRMCEERGGSLVRDVTFGTDSFVVRADLIKPYERLVFSMQLTT